MLLIASFIAALHRAEAELLRGAVRGPVLAVGREGAAGRRRRPVVAAEHVVGRVVGEGRDRRRGRRPGRIRWAVRARGQKRPHEKW